MQKQPFKGVLDNRQLIKKRDSEEAVFLWINAKI